MELKLIKEFADISVGDTVWWRQRSGKNIKGKVAKIKGHYAYIKVTTGKLFGKIYKKLIQDVSKN